MYAWDLLKVPSESSTLGIEMCVKSLKFGNLTSMMVFQKRVSPHCQPSHSVGQIVQMSVCSLFISLQLHLYLIFGYPTPRMALFVGLSVRDKMLHTLYHTLQRPGS